MEDKKAKKILTDLAFDGERVKTEEFYALQRGVIALKENQQYREIGTVEDFRALNEKSKPKKPIERIKMIGLDKGGKCPTCQRYINNNKHWLYCECGQKLDWE